MAVLVADSIDKAWGDRAILRELSVSVDKGERLGLVGPNGCGKSTLLSIMGGDEPCDGGEIRFQGSRGILGQDPHLAGETVADAVRAALEWHHALLDRYHAALDAGRMRDAQSLQDQLDLHGWDHDHRAAAMLQRVGAPAMDARLDKLSGGQRRRVALAATLLGEPDILLLDEPTNHLDAAAVDWLQEWLERYKGTVILVTHDRYLLEAVASRIVEIDDGVAVSYDGSYADYLIARAERQAMLQRREDSRLGMIRREAEWASRSPAARSTKQRARLDRLKVMRDQRPLKKSEMFKLDFRTGLKQGQTVLEAHGLKKSYGELKILEGLDLSMLRGDRLGVLGANGVGKSTLLKILLGTESLDSGQMRFAPRVNVAYLDQQRSALKATDSVYEAMGDGKDKILVGDNWVHVVGYLQRFLFPKSMHDQTVATLSGGERARLLLAKMLLEGANFLILDEPTNDLDLMTLRVLEEALLDFDGSCVVVTHDRAFLDRVCTGILAFEGDGKIVRYASRSQAEAGMAAKAEVKVSKPKAQRKPDRPKKLSWKEQREFDALPQNLEDAELALAELEDKLADPDTWTDPAGARLVQEQHAAATAKVEALYERWEELEARA